MTYLLLVNSDGQASTSRLVIRELREFPGGEGLSVHFRPARNDLLFESAKVAGRLAYRILSGEGRVRSQLWVEYEVLGPHVNVTGAQQRSIVCPRIDHFQMEDERPLPGYCSHRHARRGQRHTERRGGICGTRRQTHC
jgi:hypothetical protein